MKHNISRRLFLQSLVVFLAGKSINVYANEQKVIDKNIIEIRDEIIINSPIKDVFLFMTQLENAHKISDHVEDIEIINNSKGKGGIYSRNLVIHGISNKQIVTVTDIKHNQLYRTDTKLFGIEVRHIYHFTSISENTTKITLVKEAHIKNWIDYTLKAFVKHQMNRPEHDGQHLLVIKSVFDSV